MEERLILAAYKAIGGPRKLLGASIWGEPSAFFSRARSRVLIHAHQLSAQVLHADETRWMLLQKGGSKQWHAWALSTEDAVYYHIDPSRGAAVPLELMKGYKGVVMAAGYVSYPTLAAAFAPYLLRPCFRSRTPAASRVPRMMWYLTDGRSLTRPPRTRTTECSWRLWPMPGM